MDSYEKIINEVNNIVEQSVNAHELLQRVKESKIINLENDLDIICGEIKQNKKHIFDEFIEILVQEGRFDLIKSNLRDIGIENILDITLELNNKELTDFTTENFKTLMHIGYKTGYVSIECIAPFLLNDEISKEIIESIPIIAKNMWSRDRMELIDIIVEADTKLGNIEDYISSFLNIPDEKLTIAINYVLYKLEEVEYLDKTKLLQEIYNNIDKFIEFYDEDHTYELNDFLNTTKGISDSITNDSEEIINLKNNLNTRILSKFEKLIEKHYYDIDLIENFRRFGIDSLRIKNIQDNIIDELSGGDLVRYIESAKANEEFDKNWDFLKLTNELFKYNEEVKDDELIKVTIAKLLEELGEHENVSVADIEYAGSGFFNFNIKIGNYVLKLGENIKLKGKNEIPHDKRILKPIIRQFNNPENKQGVANIYLEIQNLVDANWYVGLSEDEIKEQLYVVYKGLRDRGIRWTDVKPENVGRLLKPNKENFKIETLNQNGEIEKVEIKSDNYAIGFIGKESDEILGPGELVVIDIDRIYKETDEYDVPETTYYDELEYRYLKEKRESKEKLKTDNIKGIIESEGYTLEDLGTIEKKLPKEKNKRKGE